MPGVPVVPRDRDELYGRAEYLRAVAGHGVTPRDVVVWLPDGYDQGGSRYPVLYMHDGHNLVDPATSYTGDDWQIDDVATAMIAAGRIVPFLVVGIYSGDERLSVLPSDRYRRFLIDTVKPMVDERFRTLPGREHTSVMGSSMGGLASFLAILRRPDVFAAAGCLSPYFPEVLVDELVAGPGLDPSLRLYLDNGDDDLDSSFQPQIDRVLASLSRSGFSDGDNLAWFRDVGGAHEEKAWSARLWLPLEFLYVPSTSPST